MIAVGTMRSVNPLLILGAMLLNAVYSLACAIVGLTTTTTKMVGGVVAASWRPLALFAGLVGCVALVMAFWVVVVQLAGGMAITALVGLGLKALWGI
jgi:hypothetical protein